MLNSTSTHPVDLTSQGSEYIRSAPRTRDVAATSATTPPQGGLVANFYARPYPTADELSMSGIDDTELQGIVGELRSEVEAVKEETVMLSYNVELLRARRAGGPGAAPAAAAHSTTNASGTGEVTSGVGHTMTNFFSNTNDMTQGEDLAAIGETPMQTNLGASFSSISSGLGNTQSGRRGKGFRRRSNEAVDLCVSVEDKMTMLAKEGDRIRQQEEKTNREAESIRGLLGATVEEAVRRMKELRLEVQQFQREVVDEESGTASADELVRYMSRRRAAQDSYLDKLVGQCQAAETDIVRAQQELRQRRAAGEAFHAIDFEQLRIENQQFNERIDKKNAELVELKGTSTRTVQTLNALMDALNDMTNEQGQLKKEYKSRCDYLARCSKEVVSVTKGAEGAERKNAAIKAQHEAVKVPKIEEYIAQKAELYELEKAAKNWMRKVEIAEGQVKVMRQQTRSLTRQRNAAKAYAESKKQKLAENRTNANLPAVHGGFGGIAARPPVPKLGAPPKASGLPPLAKPPTKRSADPSTNSAVPGASDTTPSSPQQKPPSPLAPTEGAAASVNPDESVNVATEGDGNELVSVTDQVPEVQVEDMDVAAEDESPA